MLLNCSVGEDSWESLGLQEDSTSQSKRKSILNIHWKDWCWSWNCSTLATWCTELTHLKRPFCWERLRAGGEGDDRGWDGWMVSLTQRTWVWVNSGSWWWTGRPGVLHSMGSQRVGYDWVTELEQNSAYKLNKQGDNIQPWRTPFPIWNQSVVPCPVQIIASWFAYRFLRKQVKWSGFPSLKEISTVCCDPQSKSLA